MFHLTDGWLQDLPVAAAAWGRSLRLTQPPPSFATLQARRASWRACFALVDGVN